jgi:hypothetical protein
MGIVERIFKRKVEREEMNVLIDFLSNTANLTYVPDLYKDDLERALLLIENEDSNYVLAGQKDKFSELRSVAKYAIENGVGFRVYVVDNASYKGKIGVSSTLKKLYKLDEKKIKIGPLDLNAVEEDLESLTLKMYKEDAAMVFGPKRVKEAANKIIEPVKIKLSVISPPEKKEEKTIPAQIEENLRPYKEVKEKEKKTKRKKK